MKLRIISLATLLLSFSIYATAQKGTDDIVGVWITSGETNSAKIQIYKSEDKYFGKIIWLQNPNKDEKPKIDNNNPDKTKRTNPILGLINLTNFKFNGKDEWKGGNVYDPTSGNTYSGYMYLKDKNTLKLRGYIGFSFIGRTETWTRVI